MGDLLEELVEHNVTGAATFAESLLALPLSMNEEHRERARVAARVLLAHAEGAGWQHIWPIIKDEPEFGRSLVESVSRSARYDPVNLRQLTEEELADLFTWLARQYPPDEDPQIDGMHSVDTRESVGRWRDSVLEEIKGRGTDRAVAAIRRLVRDLPQVSYRGARRIIAASPSKATW